MTIRAIALITLASGMFSALCRAETFYYRRADGTLMFARAPDNMPGFVISRPPTLPRAPKPPETATSTHTATCPPTPTPSPTATFSPEPTRTPTHAWLGYLDQETLSIDGSGREVFTTLPLDNGWTYEAVVTGVLELEERDDRGKYWRREADARYLTDDYGNFTRQYTGQWAGDTGWLAFRGAWEVSETPGDRGAHRYVFRVSGGRGSERLSAYVKLSDGLRNATVPSGSLRVEIRRLEPYPPPTQIPRAFARVVPNRETAAVGFAHGRIDILILLAMAVLSVAAGLLHLNHPAGSKAEAAREEKRRKEEERRQEELEAAARRDSEGQRKREEAERAARRAAEAARERRFTELVCRYETLERYENPRFLSALARRDKGKFLERKEHILTDYVELQKNQLLATMLRRRRPDIWRRLTSEVELLRIAETIDVLGEPPNLDHLQELPHYEDGSFINAYARTYTARLLADKNRIIEEYRKLHEHPDFVEALKREHPHVYRRALWEIRALMVAEELAAKPPNKRPRKMTTQEFRAAEARRQEVRALDKMEEREVSIRNVLQFKKRLDNYDDLDPDEREAMVRDFADSLKKEETLPGTVV